MNIKHKQISKDSVFNFLNKASRIILIVSLIFFILWTIIGGIETFIQSLNYKSSYEYQMTHGYHTIASGHLYSWISVTASAVSYVLVIPLLVLAIKYIVNEQYEHNVSIGVIFFSLSLIYLFMAISRFFLQLIGENDYYAAHGLIYTFLFIFSIICSLMNFISNVKYPNIPLIFSLAVVVILLIASTIFININFAINIVVELITLVIFLISLIVKLIIQK